ncbi:MAG: ketoacyl-synthetase C-terminal extension domain-containing protein, partial [Pseudomonadota bacterium]
NLHPWKIVSFSMSRMLSPEGRCKTFAHDADGYAPGEGVAVLLLRPLEDALSNGNHIYGLIKGLAVGHGGRAKSLTAPRVAAQREVIEAAYREAGFTPDTVTYVEAHGTGTSLGDPIEIEALSRAFRPYSGDRHYCALGSVKTNIGHLEAAAGIAGVIKVLLMMKYRTLPRTLNVEEVNPVIQLEESPFYIAKDQCPWKPKNPGLPLRAGVSSFGFGGTNGHILLESFSPKPAGRAKAKGPVAYPFLLSAKSGNSLHRLIDRWKAFVERKDFDRYDLNDICMTLMSGREGFPFRCGFLLKDKGEIAHFLRRGASSVPTAPSRPPACLRIFGLPWRGYQELGPHVGQDRLFAQSLAQSLRFLREIRIDLPSMQGFRRALWPEPVPSLYPLIADYAFISTLLEAGFSPSLITGGERGLWVALAVSGILDFQDVLRIQAVEKDPVPLTAKRPGIPFFDPVTRRTLMPFVIDADYLLSLTRDLTIEAEPLAQLVRQARSLMPHQHTFRKYLEEWNPPLKQAGMSIEDLLEDDRLLTGKGDDFRNKRLILAFILSSSTTRLYKKWDLTPRRPIRDPRFQEILDLLTDGLLSQKDLVHLILEHSLKVEEIAARCHRLQDRIDGDKPYSLLRQRNREIKEISDWAEWLKEARRASLPSPLPGNPACLDFGENPGHPPAHEDLPTAGPGAAGRLCPLLDRMAPELSLGQG